MIRIIIGALAFLAGYYYRSWWGLLGIIPIITGAIRYCPLNALLGVSTCEAEDK